MEASGFIILHGFKKSHSILERKFGKKKVKKICKVNSFGKLYLPTISVLVSRFFKHKLPINYN